MAIRKLTGSFSFLIQSLEKSRLETVTRLFLSTFKRARTEVFMSGTSADIAQFGTAKRIDRLLQLSALTLAASIQSEAAHSGSSLTVLVPRQPTGTSQCIRRRFCSER